MYFDCDYKYIRWIDRAGARQIKSLAYGCHAKVLTYDSENSVLGMVVSDHIKGFKNKDLKMISFLKQDNLKGKVPRGIVEIFPNIEGLLIQICKIQELTNNDLKQFGKKLLHLSMAGNDLKYLDQNLFDFTPNIIYLNFRDNKIKHLGTDILKPLESLITFQFIGNSCKVKDVIKGTVKEIAALKKEINTKCPPSREMLEMEDHRSKLLKRMNFMVYMKNPFVNE